MRNTKNYYDVGGKRTIFGGQMDRPGAPVLPTDVLQAQLVQRYKGAPDAASATAVHAAIDMASAVQAIIAAITNPDYPRNITIKGNVSGITGNVVITGTNILDEVITDTIALNGATEVEGVKAFKTVTKIDLPARAHTPAYQVETATAAGTITGSGNASVVVTAAGMTGTPKTISVAVLENDTAAQWAAKVREALAADAAVSAMFTVGGETDKIILTRKAYAANDSTLNIALANGTCTGITQAASSADTTAGVPVDTVSVGMGKKFGMPHIIAGASYLLLALFNGSDDSGGSLAVDDDEIEKNLYSLAGTPDGAKVLELVYLV